MQGSSAQSISANILRPLSGTDDGIHHPKPERSASHGLGLRQDRHAFLRRWEVFQTSEKSGPPRGLQKDMRSPLPDRLKQEESSLQVTLGKRIEFLSSEFLYLLGSLPLNLKKIQESSLLVSMDRTPPVFKNKVKVFYLILDKESFLPCNQKVENSTSKDRQAPPTSRETRELRARLSRQEATEGKRSCLSDSHVEKM